MSDVLYSTDGEIFQYDSVDELMTTEDIDSCVAGTVIFEGEVYDLGTTWVDASDIIDLIGERWYDAGGEESDPFEVSAEAIEELESFLQQWQENYAQPPFKGIKYVLPYYITQDDLDRVRGDNDE